MGNYDQKNSETLFSIQTGGVQSHLHYKASVRKNGHKRDCSTGQAVLNLQTDCLPESL